MSPVGGDGWRPPRAGTLIGAGAAMLALGALFRLLPWLDLWVSDIFHVTGQGFVLRDGWLPVLLYRAVNWLQIVAVAALVLIGAVWLWRRSPPFGLNPRAILLFAGTLAIGSGLLVNAVFKDQWGRARPAQIERYGGPLAFTPPGLMADQCARNCSFTAGHPALIFAGFGLAFGLAGARRRRRAVIAVAAVGGVVGLGRVVQGGHFLSDVLFSGLICFAVAAALAMMLPWAVARWPGRAKFGAAEAAALRSRAAALAKTGGDALAAAARATVDGARAGPLWAVSIGALAVLSLSIAMIDQPLALWLKQFDTDALPDFFRAITFLGRSPLWLTLSGLAAVGFWLAARRAPAAGGRARLEAWAAKSAFVFASVAVPSLAASLFKVTLGRIRPRVFFYDGSYGFAPLSFGIDANALPSGHSTVAAGLATGLALIWPRLWPAWLAFALLIAASRVVTTVHYLGDAVAGLWLGSFVVLALAMVSRRRGLDIVALDFDHRGRPRRAAGPTPA